MFYWLYFFTLHACHDKIYLPKSGRKGAGFIDQTFDFALLSFMKEVALLVPPQYLV